jgi:hypothetical protein
MLLSLRLMQQCENSAAVEVTKDIIWFRELLGELQVGFDQIEPTTQLSMRTMHQ